MSLLTSRGSTKSPHYEVFLQSVENGRKFLRRGIEVDERCSETDRETKIRACEYYKQGIDACKAALAVNMMDIPENLRAEVRATKEKIKGNLRAAEDRFVDLTNKLLGKDSARQPSPLASSAIKSNLPTSSRTSSEVSAPKSDHPPRATKPPLTEFAYIRKTARSVERKHKAGSSSDITDHSQCLPPKKAVPPQVLSKAPTVPVAQKSSGTGVPRTATAKLVPGAPTLIGKASVNSRAVGNTSSTKSSSDRSMGSGRRVLCESRHLNTIAVKNICLPSRAQMMKGVDPKFGNLLLDEILDHTEVSLNDVYGCEGAKQALEEAVILPALNPALFSGLRQPVKGILLFGPPGNGKTLLAKAVATESGQFFFNISAASLTSKWVGDAEKTVRSLFQIARNCQPCIIFIDEIDSILCERNEKEAESSRRMKTEFLIQFDGATSSTKDRILVVGATNRPNDLDDAVLRRFPKRIMLDLPDEKARYALIDNTLKKYNARGSLSDSDIRYIAAQTNGYSNSDLVALCKEAAMVPVRDLDRKKLATTNEKRLRPLAARDFQEALRVIRPSTSEKHLTTLKDFASRAGQAV